MAPGEPPRKPWGAPASYGRGAKKPPAVGARARRSSAPVYNPPVPRAARGNDDEGDSAPSRAGTVDDANFRAWQRVASNAKASSRPEKKDASKASTPPSPFGSDIDALAAPDGSYVPLGENTHASFHDLGPEEKRKVAKLIRQVVELSEARSKLEKELDELRARCSTEEGARKDAEAAEANGRAEIETLRGKLADALATINALARGETRGLLAAGPSGALTITPLPDTPARAASNVAANDDPTVASPPTDTAVHATVGSPPETIVVRTSGGAPREEATPEPSTPPAVVVAAAAAAAAVAAAPANAKATPAAKRPPRTAVSPFVPGLSPGSARDLRWLSAVQSGASRAPAWAKASMLAAAARNAAALKTAPGSDSSSPYTSPGGLSGATTNMTLSPDSVGSVAAPSPSHVNDAGRRPEARDDDDARAEAHESSSAKDGEGRRRSSCPSSSAPPELPREVLAAAKAAAASDPDDALVAALAAAAAARAGIHWEPFGNSPSGAGSPRVAAAGAQGVVERPKVLRFDPEMGPSGAFYFADASVDTTSADTTSASSMAAGSPVGGGPGGGSDSFDASFAVERARGASERGETNEGTNGEESEDSKNVVADVAEKVTGRTVADVLGVDEDGRRVSAEEAARFMLRVDREMTSYAAAAAAPRSAPTPPATRRPATRPSSPGCIAPTVATRRNPDHDATFAFSDASFSAVMQPPDMSPPSRIIEEFLVLEGTTPAPPAADDDSRDGRRLGAPSPETAAALEACLGVTEPRADPVGDHVSSAPVTPVRAFDEFVKRRHGDGRASSIVAAAAEQVRLGESNKGRGGANGVVSGPPRGGRAGATMASSPSPPPSSLGGFGGKDGGRKPAFVLTPNSLATRREKAVTVAERLLALERTEAAAGEVVAAGKDVDVPSPSPEPPAEAAAARTPAPVAWEIPSPPEPPPPVENPSNPVESARARKAVAGADGTPRGKDTPARLLDDARASAFDVSLVDLVDEAEAMLREEETLDLDLSDDDDDDADDGHATGRRRSRPSRHPGTAGTRGGATDKPPSPRTGDAKRASRGAGGRVALAGRKGPPARRTPLGPMRQKDYNKFGGVRTPPSGGERKKPGWFTSYRSFSVGRAGEPGL